MTSSEQPSGRPAMGRVSEPQETRRPGPCLARSGAAASGAISITIVTALSTLAMALRLDYGHVCASALFL